MRRPFAFLLALGIIVLLAWNSGGFFFQRPYYEYWDSAANSLFVQQAKHFQLLYGPYSRYLFNHPGPAFFYVYAFGEWLFYDLMHVVPSPVQGQLLINLCVVTGFYVTALSIFAHWLPRRARWAFLCAALAFGIVHFSLMKNLPSYEVLDSPSAFLSVWPIHPMILPFICLLAAGASVGAGRGRHLPVLILAGGFLLVHVTQPLFVGPTGLCAYLGLVVSCAARQRAGGETPTRRGWLLSAWREDRPAHVVAGVLLFIFLLPMLIDLCWGRDSNFAAILRHMHETPGVHKPLTRAVAFFLLFGGYMAYQPGRIDFGHYDLPGFLAYLRAHAPLYVGWLVVLGLVVQAPFAYARTALARRRAGTALPAPADDEETPRYLAWVAGLLALNVVLALYWETKQDGLMYYYLSWCNFSIYYVAALVAVAALLTGRRFARFTAPGAEKAGETHRGKWLASRLAGVAVLALMAYGFADRLRIHEYAPDAMREMHASVERAMAISDANHPGACKVLIMPDSHWPLAIGAGLQLARAGERFVVSAGRWKNIFDAHHLWQGQGVKELRVDLCPWYVLTRGQGMDGVPWNAPTYQLTHDAEVMLTPPTLELGAPGSALELNFVQNGNYNEYALAGWATPEQFGTWSESPWAALAFHPQVVQGSGVEILLSGLPFLSPAHGLSRQRVRLYFKGVLVGPEQQLSAAGVVPFIIPAANWNDAATQPDPQISLAFEFPDAVVPAKLDPAQPNGDPRALGIFFQKVRLRVIP